MMIAEYELPEARRNVRDCDHAGRPALYRWDIGTIWQCDECDKCFVVTVAFADKRFWCGPLTQERAESFSKWLRHDKDAAA